MVAGQLFRARVGEAYVLLCVVLAAIAILPAEPSSLAYYGLMVATLPISLVAATVTYLGGVLIFGPDPDGLLARGAIFVMWVALATVQMIAIRALIRTRNRPSPEIS